MTRDLHSNIKVSPEIDPAAIISGNGTTTGNTIDTVDYASLEFVFQSGAVTDGTFTITIYHGDASNMSDEAACSSTDLLGSAPTFVGATSADDSATKRVGYRGSKRYVRAKAVQTGATTGGFFSAIAVQGHPRTAPVA